MFGSSEVKRGAADGKADAEAGRPHRFAHIPEGQRSGVSAAYENGYTPAYYRAARGKR